MKIKIKTTTVKEVEKDLPFFMREPDDKFYAIISEEEMIAVYDWDRPMINHCFLSIKEGMVESTQKEFEDAFVRASDKLADTFENMRDVIRDKKRERYVAIIAGEGEE